MMGTSLCIVILCRTSLDVIGIRTSEFNNSPKTQEQGFGLHIGASYIKHKEKDTEDMDVAKYCEGKRKNEAAIPCVLVTIKFYV